MCNKLVRRSAIKTDLEDLAENSIDHHVSRGREGSLGETILQEDNAPAESVLSDQNEEDSLHLDSGFPFKLHLMLENAKKDGYDHIVSWLDNGTAFKVRNIEEFVGKVMPIYFDQSKYESFRRQLNLYGFSRLARGEDRGVVSHPNFVQADRSLCMKITRKPQTSKRGPA